MLDPDALECVRNEEVVMKAATMAGIEREPWLAGVCASG